jgi:hypothetical protein
LADSDAAVASLDSEAVIDRMLAFLKASLMPQSTSSRFLRILQQDEYYGLLVPVTVPVTLVAVRDERGHTTSAVHRSFQLTIVQKI